MSYTELENADGVPLRVWGYELMDENTIEQMKKICQVPCVYPWAALMPDGHVGIGTTVGSVIPTQNAVIVAAVGVDIGCGMIATNLGFKRERLPVDLKPLRAAMENAVPHGRTLNGGAGDRGAWSNIPETVSKEWENGLSEKYDDLCKRHPRMRSKNNVNQLGTLGTGNHFLELCVDEDNNVWILLHSGSRGPGNRIGSYFLEEAKKQPQPALLDKDLAFLSKPSPLFNDYLEAVNWAQEFARINRLIMMSNAIAAVRKMGMPAGWLDSVHCHHNYISQEKHYGCDLIITRKGAVRAFEGDLGIIPGSMGANSFIVRGRGNPDSFCSCSHGAGRRMSRNKAKTTFTLEDHARDTATIECRKDADVLDETPGAYKPIEEVMKAQADLVDIVHCLKQLICIKG